MKLLLVIVGALAFFSLSTAQKFTCPSGSSSETIKVKNKAKLTFIVPKKTPNNLDCEAKYEMTTCSRVKIACNFKFKVFKKKCTPDQAVITYSDGKNTTLCGKKGKLKPTNVNGNFEIRVTTDGRKPSRGGNCKIKCTKKGKPPAPTPAPTAAPTTGGTCDCYCGVAQRGTRIVGGVETEVSEYPWQAGLVSKGSSFVWCGGSLVNSKWVLTAAHCTVNAKANKIQVLLGEHDYDTAGETNMVRMNVAKIFNHGNYDDSTLQYDYSMLKLKTAVDFCSNPHIRPVCLPTDTTNTYAGVQATVTGWGTTSSGGSVSNVMREVDVTVLSNNQCKNDYSYSSNQIKSQMLCANVDGGGKDACQGDSGGPLVSPFNAADQYELIGVVSWGIGCALSDYPGVYARVTSELDWINNYLAQDGQFCPSAIP